MRHLADHGHRHIAYLGDWLEIATARQRFQGYREACFDLGLRPRPHHVVHDLRSAESAAAAVTALLRADDAPTALFTSQNLVTIGAVRTLPAARERSHSPTRARHLATMREWRV